MIAGVCCVVVSCDASLYPFVIQCATKWGHFQANVLLHVHIQLHNYHSLYSKTLPFVKQGTVVWRREILLARRPQSRLLCINDPQYYCSLPFQAPNGGTIQVQRSVNATKSRISEEPVTRTQQEFILWFIRRLSWRRFRYIQTWLIQSIDAWTGAVTESSFWFDGTQLLSSIRLICRQIDMLSLVTIVDIHRTLLWWCTGNSQVNVYTRAR